MTSSRPVALVTGASSGIGEAAAAALVEAGFDVIGTSRNTADVRAPRRGHVPRPRRDQRRVGGGPRRSGDRPVRADRCARQQRWCRRRGRRRGELHRTGPARVRRELLRRDPDDQGGPAAHARTGGRADHQHLVGPRLRAGALRCAVRRLQARDRGLLRVGRSRGPPAWCPRAPRRAGVHQDGIRRQHRAARNDARGLRERPTTGRGGRGGVPGIRRCAVGRRRDDRQGRHRREAEAALSRRQAGQTAADLAAHRSGPHASTSRSTSSTGSRPDRQPAAPVHRPTPTELPRRHPP